MKVAIRMKILLPDDIVKVKCSLANTGLFLESIEVYPWKTGRLNVPSAETETRCICPWIWDISMRDHQCLVKAGAWSPCHILEDLNNNPV